MPGTGSDVVISNSSAPNQPILPGNITLRDFTISAGSIDLAGFQITVTRNYLSSGGTISNGVIAANNFTTLQNTVFNGTISLIKTGGNNNSTEGGNTFNGPTTIRNNDNSRLRLSNTNGDTFNSSIRFIKGSTGDLQIAYNGTNQFNGGITLESLNNSGTLSFGLGGGSSVLNLGGLLNGSFALGNLDIRNFTQVQNAANGAFGVEDFSVGNSVFLGNFSVTSADDLNFLGNNVFNGSNTFISGGNLDADGNNQFSVPAGTSTIFIKNGTGNDNWEGGNIFGTVSFTNNSSSRIRLANSIGDSYLRDATFISASTGAMEPAYNGISTFSGNISTVGSSQAITFGLGLGTAQIVGNTSQFWQGDLPTSPIVERLVMNTNGTLTLSVPLLVDVSATFTNGIINSDATNLLIIDNGATSAGLSNSSHVDGPVQKIGNQAFTFPVGDGGFYAPLIMANRGGGGTDIYTAQYFQIAPVDIPTDTTSRDATIGLMNQTEHWDLQRSAGTVARGVTLSYDVSRTSPIIDHTELVSIFWNGSSWIDLGGTISGNATSGTITAGTTSNLGQFSIGSSFRILPIELISFTAMQTETRDILIEWKTASERNNSHFILERSFDGKNWETITLKPGAGDSLEPLSYRHLDTNPQFGRNFYRLTQVDFDGLTTVYQTIAVSLIGENSTNLQIKVFPNPTQGKIYLESQNLNLDGMKVDILNLNGQSVLQSESIRNSRAEFDLSYLPKGIYILKLYSAREIITKKLILQ